MIKELIPKMGKRAKFVQKLEKFKRTSLVSKKCFVSVYYNRGLQIEVKNSLTGPFNLYTCFILDKQSCFEKKLINSNRPIIQKISII